MQSYYVDISGIPPYFTMVFMFHNIVTVNFIVLHQFADGKSGPESLRLQPALPGARGPEPRPEQRPGSGSLRLTAGVTGGCQAAAARLWRPG